MLKHSAVEYQVNIARKVALVVVFALLTLAACVPVSSPSAAEASAPAEASPAHASGMPMIDVEFGLEGITMPSEVPAGPVHVHLSVAEGASPKYTLARFLDGKSMQDLGAAAAQEATAGPAPLFEVVNFYGSVRGPSASDLVIDFKEGDHVAFSVGNGPPLIWPFTVVKPEAVAETPTAEVNATMKDFTFELPEEIAAGPQVWRFANAGGQWHETAIYKVEEGMSVESLAEAALAAEQGGEGGPTPVVVWAPISGGEQGWATIDLPAGDYIVICFLPDLAGNMSPHFTHGMVRQLAVR